MQNNTVTAPVEMPVIDSPLDPEVADGLGDDVLRSAAAANRVQTVPATGRSFSAAESRAWTFGGSVD